MKFMDAVKSRIGRPDSDREALGALREEHGRHTSRYLADRLGVSVRQAQRYLRGDIRRVSSERSTLIRGAVDNNRLAAQRIRNARIVSVGKVSAVSKSKGTSTGSRSIGVLTIDATMRQELDRAAADLEAGNVREAEEAISAAILGGYGVAKGGNRDSARGAIEIDDYSSGINFT